MAELSFSHFQGQGGIIEPAQRIVRKGKQARDGKHPVWVNDCVCVCVSVPQAVCLAVFGEEDRLVPAMNAPCFARPLPQLFH